MEISLKDAVMNRHSVRGFLSKQVPEATLKEVFERDRVVHEYKEWDELWHVFQVEALLPESIESFKMFGSFLNKYIGVKV